MSSDISTQFTGGARHDRVWYGVENKIEYSEDVGGKGRGVTIVGGFLEGGDDRGAP